MSGSQLTSFQNFQDKLKKLGHYYTVYENIEDLKYRFSEQLIKLEDSLLKIPISDGSQLDQLENLRQEMVDKESTQQQFKQSEVTYQQAKEKLEQQLEQEKLRFSKQQNNLQAAKNKIVEQESIITQLQKQIEQLKFNLKIAIKVELKSEKGVDYSKLRNLLEQKQWKEADVETSNVMLQAANRRRDQQLGQEDIKNFPSEDLRIINQLWLYFSEEKFGFSVQKEIYESIGGRQEYNEKIWNDFGDIVGWRKDKNWLDNSNSTFYLNAPKAHLPSKLWLFPTSLFSLLGAQYKGGVSSYYSHLLLREEL